MATKGNRSQTIKADAINSLISPPSIRTPR